jgi:hypothetical protein
MSTSPMASALPETEIESDPEQDLLEMSEDFDEMVRRISFAQDQLGRAYSLAVSRKLAEQAGYKNAWTYFSTRVRGLTRTMLNRYSLATIRWAPTFIHQYGMERLQALSTYVLHHGASDINATDPGVLKIRVPQPGGLEEVKTFAECGLEEMRRAVRGRRPPKTRVPVTDAVRTLFLESSFFRHFNGVAPVRLNVRTENGRSLVTVHDVPMAELERLIKALRAGLDEQPFALRDDSPPPA